MRIDELTVAQLTIDDYVKLKIALNNGLIAYKRLLAADAQWSPLFRAELKQIEEGKEALARSMQRENESYEKNN